MLLNTAGVNSNKTQWVNKKTIVMSNGLAADYPLIGCKALFHPGRTLATSKRTARKPAAVSVSTGRA